MNLFRHKNRKPSYGFFNSFDYCVPSWTNIGWIVLLFIVGALLSNLWTLLCAKYLPQESLSSVSLLVGYPLMFVPPMLYASVVSRNNAGFCDGLAMDSNNFGNVKAWLLALIVSFMTIAAAYLSEIFVWLLPPMPQTLKDAMEMLTNGPLWISLLSVSVFAPIFEEWLCRGMLLRGLLQKLHPAVAIIISAVFFALIHLNPWQAIPAFIFGCLFGYVYYRTGSLKLTMLMHCVNNTFSVLIAKIPALKGVDYFIDVVEPWAYWLNYAAFLLVVAAGIVVLRGIKLPEGERSACHRLSCKD